MNMSTKRRLQPRRRGSQLFVAILLCTAALFGGLGADSILAQLAQPLGLDAPDLSVTVKEGTAFTIDTGIQFDALYKVQPTNVTPTTPAHGDVTGLPNAINGNFALNYTPDPFYSGPDTFFYHFCLADGTQECYDPGEVTVTVTPVNNAPVATDDTAAVDEDSSVNIAVLGNDTAGPAGSGESQTLTIINVAVHANGEATTNGSTITYSPDPDYCNDGTPTDDFTYTVRDDTSIDGTAKTATATVRVTVNCVNDAPTADDIDASTDENTATTFGITGDDNDGVGQALTIVSVTQPAHGKVTATATSLTYTPDPYYCNDGDPTDNFTYTMEDDDTFGTGTALSATATVAMTVNCVYDKPIIIIQPQRDDEGDVIVDDHMMHADIILVSHYENVTGLDFMVTYPRCEMNPVITEGPGEDFYFASQVNSAGLHIIIGPDLIDQTPILAGPAISNPIAKVATIKFTFDAACFPSPLDEVGQTRFTIRVDQGNPKYSNESATSLDIDTTTPNNERRFRSPENAQVQGNEIPGPIALSGTSVPQDITGAFVGFLSTADDDDGDTHQYNFDLTCPNASNQGRFEIVDNRYVKLISGQKLSAGESAVLCIQSKDNFGAIVQQEFSINVTSVNQPPQAVDDPESGFGGYSPNDFVIQAPTDLPVLANDHDPDGDTTFSISAVTQPAHGMVVNNGTDVTYIPTDPKFRGPTATDTFRYTILDDGGLSDEAEVTVTVDPEAEPGDCNIHIDYPNNIGIDIGDITALGLEFFDDDDNSNWYATLDDIPFEGDPYGCDANQDAEIGIPDLICIGILFFGGDCSDTVLAAGTMAPATLTAGSTEATAPGATVDIPIILGTSGNNVVGAGFAIKIDTAAVSFDSTDSDGDGLPDAFKASVPENVIVTATYDEENTQIEVIFYTLPPFTALQDGTLATVTLTVNEDINVDTTTVTLTNSSFSNERAQAVPVEVTNGAIQIVVEGQSPASILYLPSIQR